MVMIIQEANVQIAEGAPAGEPSAVSAGRTWRTLVQTNAQSTRGVGPCGSGYAPVTLRVTIRLTDGVALRYTRRLVSAADRFLMIMDIFSSDPSLLGGSVADHAIKKMPRVSRTLPVLPIAAPMDARFSRPSRRPLAALSFRAGASSSALTVLSLSVCVAEPDNTRNSISSPTFALTISRMSRRWGSSHCWLSRR